MALLQTRDGYIWLGTERGLARFDGQKFTVYDHVTTAEMPVDYCASLAEDSEGSLWIGLAPGGGILRKSGELFKSFAAQEPRLKIGSCSVFASRFGGIWSGAEGALCRIQGDQLKYYLLPNGAHGELYPLHEDERGGLLVGSWDGLKRFDPRSESFTSLEAPPGPNRLAPLAACDRAKGGLWVLLAEPPSPANNLVTTGWVACLNGDRWETLSDAPVEGFAFDSRSHFVVRDPLDELWFPGSGQGLNRKVEGRLESLPMAHSGEKDFAMCALADREGNMWIGTDFSGLQEWTPRKVTLYTTQDGLVDTNVWSVFEAHDGTLWIGTDGGLSHFNNGEFTNFAAREGLSCNQIRSVVEARDGTVYVGTIRSLEVMRDGLISQHPLPGEWEETKIRCLLAARDGAVWVGTVRGLTRLSNGERKKFSGPDELGQREVRALLEDQNGDIWVGTQGAGLSRLHAGKFTIWTKADGLCNDNVWALYQGSDRAIWIGTENGLNVFKDGHLAAFTTAQGLPVNQINSVLEDNFGRLWISHDHGLYWVSKAQFTEILTKRRARVDAVDYDEFDGVSGLEFNGQKSNPAACKTRDGRLWFPTSKGLLTVDPSRVVGDDIPPLTVIEQVRANGMAIRDLNRDSAPHGASEPLAASSTVITTHPAKRRLPPGEARVMEFRYRANTFVVPEKARFKYRLKGLSDQWIEAETRRSALFTGLGPGSYSFEVTACNHHGVWQTQATTFGFAIVAPVYQRWWFYTVCAMGLSAGLLAVLGWGGRRLRSLYLLQQQKALAEQRERIARDIHDELGASLTQIVHLSELEDLGAGQPALSTDQIRRIGSVAKTTVAHIGEIVWATNPKYDTLFDLVGYLRECCAQYFVPTRVRVTLEFPEQVPTRNVTGLFRRNLLLVAKEALQNVAKHADATRVRVKLELSATGLELTVTDDGRGLSDSAVGLTGQGMGNMRRRVSELRGTFNLESPPGGGTSVRVSVPLPPVEVRP
jgi:ligand-binding sensor domain-containing protein/signal transduction histidine kinase